MPDEGLRRASEADKSAAGGNEHVIMRRADKLSQTRASQVLAKRQDGPGAMKRRSRQRGRTTNPVVVGCSLSAALAASSPAYEPGNRPKSSSR